MINKGELIRRMKNGCSCVCSAESELTEIDAKFGDADHGFTMVKICNTDTKSVGRSRRKHKRNAGRRCYGSNGLKRRQRSASVEHLA